MSDAKLQNWVNTVVEGQPEPVRVLATDIPDSLVGGSTGTFKIYNPFDSYKKGDMIIAPTAAVPKFGGGTNTIQTGIYGCHKDVSGGDNIPPNFPERLQSDLRWHFLAYLPRQVATCDNGVINLQCGEPI